MDLQMNNIQSMPIDKVVPYDKNPRLNDDAVEPTDKSIKEFGWQQPIVVDKDNVVIAVHTRLKAAKKLKLKTVPVVVADKLSDEQVKAYRLADNKVGELADWDDGHEIVGVAVAPQGTQKDKMIGTALRYGIPILAEAEKLVSDDIPDGTDLIIAAHSHWIVSDPIIEKCKFGGIGFHPSLLPIHRGVDAVRWTVHMHDKISGGSVFYLNDVADGGDVIKQRILYVDPDWDYHELWRQMFPLGVDLISECVQAINEKQGKVKATPQNDKLATWEPSFARPRLRRNELFQIGLTPDN